MQTDIMKVTPTLAKQWLDTNTENNRKVREDRVKFYANEMIEGRWIESTGESIKFDRQGKLIDGQHRLLALIMANRSFRMMVVTQLDKEAFSVIDQGAKRSGADMFTISGIPNASSIAAGIKAYFFLENGQNNTNGGGKANLMLSNRELVQLYQKEPEYWQDVHRKTKAWYTSFSMIVNGAFLFGFYSLLDKTSKHKNKIESFFDQLCNDTAEHGTIKLLRKRLIEDRLKRNERLTASYKTIYFIKVWNAFVKNQDIKQLSYNPEQEQAPRAL